MYTSYTNLLLSKSKTAFTSLRDTFIFSFMLTTVKIFSKTG